MLINKCIFGMIIDMNNAFGKILYIFGIDGPKAKNILDVVEKDIVCTQFLARETARYCFLCVLKCAGCANKYSKINKKGETKFDKAINSFNKQKKKKTLFGDHFAPINESFLTIADNYYWLLGQLVKTNQENWMIVLFYILFIDYRPLSSKPKCYAKTLVDWCSKTGNGLPQISVNRINGQWCYAIKINISGEYRTFFSEYCDIDCSIKEGSDSFVKCITDIFSFLVSINAFYVPFIAEIQMYYSTHNRIFLLHLSARGIIEKGLSRIRDRDSKTYHYVVSLYNKDLTCCLSDRDRAKAALSDSVFKEIMNSIPPMKDKPERRSSLNVGMNFTLYDNLNKDQADLVDEFENQIRKIDSGIVRTDYERYIGFMTSGMNKNICWITIKFGEPYINFRAKGSKDVIRKTLLFDEIGIDIEEIIFGTRNIDDKKIIGIIDKDKPSNEERPASITRISLEELYAVVSDKDMSVDEFETYKEQLRKKGVFIIDE